MIGDDEDVTGATITVSLERLSRLMRSREHGKDLNPAQWEALRFLSRANRFSNWPGALTRYVGATKGTISQTVKSLVEKGYLSKEGREGERRSVALTLTAKGTDALVRDPWAELATAADNLGGKTKRRLAKGLRELLEEQLRMGGHLSFGLCASCRYFREKGRDRDSAGPHQCMLFDQPLSPADSQKICIEHEVG